MTGYSCAEMDERLSAHLDGELSPEERAAVDAHLASCEACRKRLELAREQDRALRQAFAPLQARANALAGRVTARLASEPPAPVAPRAPAVAPPAPALVPWLRTALAAAAGFLVAAVLFHEQAGEPPPFVPTRSPTPAPTSPATTGPPIAHLALATGALEWRPAGEPDWRPLATGAALAAGTCVRTSPGTKGSLDCSDGSEVRLNSETEIQLPAVRRFELRRGEIFTRVAHDPVRFAVDTEETRVEAIGTSLDISHEPKANAESLLVTTVTVVEGIALVGTRSVEHGYTCRVEDGRVLTPSHAEQLLVLTRWINGLLALKGGADEEFQQRVNSLLAYLGETRVQFLDESEIRSLGTACALPLTRFIESPESTNVVARRHKAARILADVAGPESIGDLAGLLRDGDPEVRVSMARGLERLTGTSLGYVEDFWRSSKFDEGADKWREYLGRRDSPWRVPSSGKKE